MQLIELLLVDANLLGTDLADIVPSDTCELFKIQWEKKNCNDNDDDDDDYCISKWMSLGVLLGSIDTCSEVVAACCIIKDNSSRKTPPYPLVLLTVMLQRSIRLSNAILQPLYPHIASLAATLPRSLSLPAIHRKSLLPSILIRYINNQELDITGEDQLEEFEIPTLCPIRLAASLLVHGLFVHACHLYWLSMSGLSIFRMDYCLRELEVEIIRKCREYPNDQVFQSARVILTQYRSIR